ncbi:MULTISPECIES: stage V sporulation protein AA [Cohnella]|jgi:stage V sporulation protein AA|uniref:stage V sporulation protein AA n=1 Tax=Cohnella TaxID=329857 RepID=UPI00035EC0E0|nr:MULTISPECIES: stage V sporulation protein AA [Cohnella]REK66075.1 MAG: stage V sporulation protein AA [Cohnella sp.]
MDQTIYLRLRRRIVVPPEAEITLGDVAVLETGPALKERLASLPLLRVKPADGSLLVIDMLLIVRKIREAWPDAVVETFGEPHVLVEVADGGKVKPRRALLVVAWLVLFFGSGMTIINFHADVDMPEVQKRITELMTGKREWHPWLFQIPYSLGLGLGMLLFFNRLFRRRLNDEPNPLEVEMFMYQENVNHYVITEEYRKQHDAEGGRRRA